MDEVADDEYLLRHIPNGTLWQAPGPRITSANFQLRYDRNETGVSVTRWKITTPQQLLTLVGGSIQAGSRVACARVAGVRALGLRVVPKPLETEGMPSSLRAPLSTTSAGPALRHAQPQARSWHTEVRHLRHV